MVEKLSSVPISVNNDVQNHPIKHESRFEMMLYNKLHNLMTFRRNMSATSFTLHSIFVGRNMTYLENWSMIMSIVSCPSTLRSLVMKSIEIESHDPSEGGRRGGGRGGEAAQAYLVGITAPPCLTGMSNMCACMSRHPIPCWVSNSSLLGVRASTVVYGVLRGAHRVLLRRVVIKVVCR